MKHCKTFQETLLLRAFEGAWPPFYTEAEVASWFSQPTVPSLMRIAYQLGKAHREGEPLTEDQKRGLNSLSPNPDFASRCLQELREEAEFRGIWAQALGQI